MQFALPCSRLTAVLLCLFVLVACSRTESVQTLEQRDLLRLVFKGWDGNSENAIVTAPQLKAELPASVQASAPLALRMQALHVQRLNENSAVLLVKGEPTEPGLPTLLAAYWFQRRAEAWSLTSRQDVVEWLGHSGRISKTSIVELFPGNFALAVEHSTVDNNEVMIVLQLFRLETDKLTPMLDKGKQVELLRHYESGPECENMMHPPKGKHSRMRLHLNENEAGPPNCYDYMAKWEISPGDDAPGLLTVDYAGKTYRYQEVAQTTDGNGERTITYDLQVGGQKGRKKLVFDTVSQKYQPRDEKPAPVSRKK